MYKTLNTGAQIPSIGLGTWKSSPGKVCQAVTEAIDIGYRHIDCAHLYGNEKEIGEGINAKIASGIVKREDLFITSKLWNTYHKPELVELALLQTLNNLNLKYLDLYLIHWPFAFQEGEELFPKEFTHIDYLDTWKAMEAICKKGLTKNIGLSNFNKHQIERILEIARIPPSVNQIECHAYLPQLTLSEFCKSKNIVVTGYCPLGSSDNPSRDVNDPQLLEDERIKNLARKYNKTPAQALLRYQIQRGHVVIPKSVNKTRLEENFSIWDFELTQEDINSINELDQKKRYCRFRMAVGHPHYPF